MNKQAYLLGYSQGIDKTANLVQGTTWAGLKGGAGAAVKNFGGFAKGMLPYALLGPAAAPAGATSGLWGDYWGKITSGAKNAAGGHVLGKMMPWLIGGAGLLGAGALGMYLMGKKKQGQDQNGVQVYNNMPPPGITGSFDQFNHRQFN
jgi:hypothetical protein